jgi:hypothetical protein
VKNLTYDDRINLERYLSSLENMDLKKVSLDRIKKRLDDVLDMFDIFKIPENHSYKKRLDDFVNKADIYYESKSGPDFNQGKRDYFGKSGKYTLRIIPVFEHIFLTRIYSKMTHLSWRFNQQGRIELIDGRFFPLKEIVHILTAKEGMNKPPFDWNKRDFFYRFMPNELGDINKGFLNLDIKQQYLSLIRFGHSTAKDFLENLKNNNITDPYDPSTSQKLLSELTKDTEALFMLKKTSNLMPVDISLLCNNNLTVFYNS